MNTNTRNTFHNYLMRLWVDHPDRDLVIDSRSGQTYSVSDFCNLTLKTVRWMRNNGAKDGACVVSSIPNSVDAIVVFAAASCMNIRFAPMSEHSTAEAILDWCKYVKADLLLTPLKTLGAGVEENIPSNLKVSAFNLEYVGVYSVEDSKGSKSAELLIQTSGTSGEPKALVHSISKLWDSAVAWSEFHQIQNSHARFLNNLPVAYLGGLFNLFFIPIACNGSVVMAQTFSGTSFLTFWNDVNRFEVDSIWLVPTILKGLLKLHERTSGKNREIYKRIKNCFIGTSILAPELKSEGEQAFGFMMLENYGLSETTFITSERKEKDWRAHQLGKLRPGVGMQLPYVNLAMLSYEKFENESGSKRESTEKMIGELVAQTPFMFNGYLNEDGAVESGVGEDGYLRTGDLGWVEPISKVVQLSGRNKDIIKKGGNLVNLNEIERVALNLKSLKDVSAVRIEHEFYGEDYVLFFSSEKVTIEPNEVSEFLQKKLPRNKLPSQIIAIEKMPTTESGKVIKSALLERLSQ